MKLQTLIEAKIVEMIEDVGLTATVENAWANTGYFLALDSDDLDIRISIHFDFQNTYFSLQVYEGQHMTGGMDRQTAVAQVSTINGMAVSEALGEVERAIAGLTNLMDPSEILGREADGL